MKQASGARNQRLAKRVVAASGASKAERKDAEREDAEIHGLVMQELDADHDGMLSMAELDRNGDGVLDADELMAAGISVAKQRMLDTNNDGHLSFSELDLNGDGILDADELEAARKSVPRLNKCYDFAWSRELWAQAAVFIQRVILVTAIIYLIIVVTVTYADGYRGADIPYSISQALLTIGLGDTSPQSQMARCVFIFTIPFGLVLIGFCLSLVKAHANAAVENLPSELFDDGDDSNDSALERWLKAFKLTTAYEVLTMFVRYVVVILIGVLFFINDETELDLQHKNGVRMTFIDSAYFATVIATTVGYGHKIWARSEGARWFCSFYFFLSTMVVGGIIGSLQRMYIDMKSKEISDIMINSTIWVHKTDLHHTNTVDAAEFVLFKLQQLQKVDENVLDRLVIRFSELDLESKGFLRIGVHVPSATQVSEMQEAVKGTSKTLSAAWKEMKEDLIKKHVAMDEEARTLLAAVDREGPPPIQLNKCHDFQWSRDLWYTAAQDALKLSLALLTVFVLSFSFMMAAEGVTGLHSFYLISATLSTVGYGDFAPKRQLSRGLSIFIIPFGLVILGLLISVASAYDLSKPVKLMRTELSEMDMKAQQMFDIIDVNHDGILTKDEVVDAHKLLNLTPEAAADLFDKLDVSNDGKIERKEKLKPSFFNTVPGKCVWLVFKMYVVIFIGAAFMKWDGDESAAQALTWVDAMYFATTTVMSVGFGDISPQTDGARAFFTVYMLVSTCFVAKMLGDLIEVFVSDYVGESIIDQLIGSVTWVHRSDVYKTGRVTESDYVLFKLQQMQKVDMAMMDVLLDRFEELDDDGHGHLDIGVEVPSAAQVKVLQHRVAGTATTLMEAWEAYKEERARGAVPAECRFGTEDFRLRAERYAAEVVKANEAKYGTSEFTQRASFYLEELAELKLTAAGPASSSSSSSSAVRNPLDPRNPLSLDRAGSVALLPGGGAALAPAKSGLKSAPRERRVVDDPDPSGPNLRRDKSFTVKTRWGSGLDGVDLAGPLRTSESFEGSAGLPLPTLGSLDQGGGGGSGGGGGGPDGGGGGGGGGGGSFSLSLARSSPRGSHRPASIDEMISEIRTSFEPSAKTEAFAGSKKSAPKKLLPMQPSAEETETVLFARLPRLE